MNRSTIYDYLRKDVPMEFRYWKIGKGQYPVLIPPYKWDRTYLLVNGSRFTDIQALVLFSEELVVRFDKYTDQQVNIPYKDIEYIEVCEDLDIGYEALWQDKKVKRF